MIDMSSLGQMDDLSKPEHAAGLLNLFVYGTLKRGYSNHQHFCEGVLRVEQATVRGQLYALPAGYPMLIVPEADILAVGTSDPHADVAVQARWAVHLDQRPTAAQKDIPATSWDTVFGEILTFDDPETRLPMLDWLEDFQADGPSLYRRVLLPVRACVTATTVVAWTYIGDAAAGRYLPGGCWPA